MSPDGVLNDCQVEAQQAPKGCGKTTIRCRLGNGVGDDRNVTQLMFAIAMVGDILLPERPDLLLLSGVFSQSISIGKIKRPRDSTRENNMKSICFELQPDDRRTPIVRSERHYSNLMKRIAG